MALRIIAILAVLAAGVLVAIRFHERSAFRNTVGPIVRSDMVDLDDFCNGQEDYLGDMEQVHRREERIRNLRIIDPARYGRAQAAFVRLMQDENEFIGAVAEFRQKEDNIRSEVKDWQFQMRLAVSVAQISTLSDSKGAPGALCEGIRQYGDVLNTGLTSFRELQLEPGLIRLYRSRPIGSWNAAYGWIRWLGVETPSRNPFVEYPEISLDTSVSEAIRYDIVEFESLKKKTDGWRSKYCGD